jgi:CheY-like chemotaxis protein
MTAEGAGVRAVRKTALVVEDERLARTLMVDALEEYGYSVLEAADGPGGLNLVRSAAPIDVLVSDHNLPGGITGYELAHRARQVRPDLVILLVSGMSGAVVTGNQPLPEKMRFLLKPFTTVRLVQTVGEMMSSAERRGDAPEV